MIPEQCVHSLATFFCNLPKAKAAEALVKISRTASKDTFHGPLEVRPVSGSVGCLFMHACFFCHNV